MKYSTVALTLGLILASSISHAFDLAIEAETADHIEPPIVVAENANASGGKFIWVEGEPDTLNPGDTRFDLTTGIGLGWAEYKIDIPKAGIYALWGKVIAWDGHSSTF